MLPFVVFATRAAFQVPSCIGIRSSGDCRLFGPLQKKLHPFARLVEVGSNWFNIWFVSSKLSGLDWFLWGPLLCWTFLCSWHSGAALCQAAEFQETGQKPWNRPEVSGKGNPKGTWLMFRNFLGLSSKHVYICLCEFTYVYICLCEFTYVYICLCEFTYVYICLCEFTYVYICLCEFT